MCSSNIDILCLTETWLSEFIYDNEIIPVGYSIYRKDRTRKGGGVLITVKDNICSHLLSSPKDLEVVSVKMQLGREVIIVTVYVPPNATTNYIYGLI